ncbi:MAG: DUF302 domain-containing protein [Lentimicrobiaceae bacterium]|nr:DUF302 domain-containing protein [Lentimicrobiaceae bacterium]
MDVLQIIKSEFSIEKTVARLIEQINESGWHLFAHIDHAEQARKNNLDLRPTQLILLGNPKIGTLLMQDCQTAAIDLPAKILVWQGEDGLTYIGYNSKEWLERRHHLKDRATLKAIDQTLENVCKAAAHQ